MVGRDHGQPTVPEGTQHVALYRGQLGEDEPAAMVEQVKDRTGCGIEIARTSQRARAQDRVVTA